MFKKIATGLLAVAATSAVALSIPTAANAAGFDDESWGPVSSQNDRATASGRVNVEWDDENESNTVSVRGRLYDLDHRTAEERGKCAYVRFQASDFDGDWSNVYRQKYCGYPKYKKFSFSTDDITSLRVQVCQIPQHSNRPNRCGDWESVYEGDEE
jgi:hypothetical protein